MMGFISKFYTLTARARYHATPQIGHRNRKWNGASPANTQHNLVRQKIRAKPHHDAALH